MDELQELFLSAQQALGRGASQAEVDAIIAESTGGQFRTVGQLGGQFADTTTAREDPGITRQILGRLNEVRRSAGRGLVEAVDAADPLGGLGARVTRAIPGMRGLEEEMIEETDRLREERPIQSFFSEVIGGVAAPPFLVGGGVGAARGAARGARAASRTARAVTDPAGAAAKQAARAADIPTVEGARSIRALEETARREQRRIGDELFGGLREQFPEGITDDAVKSVQADPQMVEFVHAAVRSGRGRGTRIPSVRKLTDEPGLARELDLSPDEVRQARSLAKRAAERAEATDPLRAHNIRVSVKQLDEALEEAAPQFRTAMREFARRGDIVDALGMGRTAQRSTRLSRDDIRGILEDFSGNPEAQRAFHQGMAFEFAETAESTGKVTKQAVERLRGAGLDIREAFETPAEFRAFQRELKAVGRAAFSRGNIARFIGTLGAGELARRVIDF